MPIFELQGPDGKTYEVDAPDMRSAAGAFRQMSSIDPGPAQAPQAAAQPDLSAGETAADVAKALGIGVAQGGIGLATLPGNVEQLGRMGVNAASRGLGGSDLVSNDAFLPTYQDAKGAIEGYTGEFYKPKTTMGEYARTIGEFAPAGVGGAGLVSRAARVAIPAIVSETAGQVTKGEAMEPWARMAGALAGGRLMNPTARVVTPAPANQARQAAVNTLGNEGVTALTAGQRTGNTRLRWVEDATAMVPFGGGRATAMQQQATEQFTRAALRRAGINADRVDPGVLNQAFTGIGREYSNFAMAANIPGRPAVAARFGRIARDYTGITTNANRVENVPALANELGQRLAAGITGQQYNAYRSELARMQRGLRSDPQAANAVGRMIGELDAAMVRSAPRGQRMAIRDALQDRNRRYRNLLIVEDASGAAGEVAASGLITPAALKNAIKKNDRKGYTRNRNDMAPLARAGVEAITPLRSSGTAERSFAQGVVAAPSTAWSGLSGAVVSGGDPLMTAGAMVAPWLIKAATSRGIMSGLGQRYFGNQRIPMDVAPVPLSATTPLAISQFAQEPDGQGLQGRTPYKPLFIQD
jgi:hypothetical protein